MTFANSTSRFSNRVQDYIRYRPHYPGEMIEAIIIHSELTPTSVIADIGSGTGISSEIFLKLGYAVIGIEPNQAMREAAENLLASYPSFVSVDGTAEATTLNDHSVDLIIAGQAFHWFDREKFREECKRILKPNGNVALFWNERLIDATEFLKEYEALIKEYATDYSKVDHRRMDDDIISQFYGKQLHIETFPNKQVLDFDGLYGRLASSSYVPAPDDPTMQEMKRKLYDLFNRHQQERKVELLYETKLYIASL